MQHFRWSPARMLLVGVGLALGAWGCQPDSDQPSGPSANMSTAPVQDRPFYYYQGTRLYLTPDHSRITVASPERNASEVITEILQRRGLAVARAEALRQAPGHWLVNVAAGNIAATRSAVAELKRDKRFRFTSTAFKTESGNNDLLLLNELIVRFKEGVTRQQIDSLNAALGTAIVRQPSPDSGFFEYRLTYPADSSADPLAIAALLDRHELVEWADPNAISDRKPAFVPTDPYYPLQWHLNNTTTRNGIRVNIDVERAWDITRGAGIPSQGGNRVGVIGDGVQMTHPDFNGHVQAGYDGFGNNSFGCTDCATSPFGDDAHETQVAGIIIAQHSNGLGVAGIAPGALVVPGRIFRNSQPASNAEIANAITYVGGLGGAAVINNSWGGGSPSNAITNAINSATTTGRGGKGIVVVFSGGNTSDRRNGRIGGLLYPATLSNVIAVGAINRTGALTNYSPEGSQLDIVAPSGHDTGRCVGEIVTTDLTGARGCNTGPSGNIDYSSTFSGTSAAAPQVAGAAALLLAKEPSLTLSQARSRILGAANPWGAATQFGAGKLNAFRMFPPPFVVTASAPGEVTAKGTYTLTGSANSSASGWRWERSDNGGPWAVWATTQNSSFFVSAGQELTISWRLFARRNSDGVTDFGFAETWVCTKTSGCIAPAAGDLAGTE